MYAHAITHEKLFLYTRMPCVTLSSISSEWKVNDTRMLQMRNISKSCGQKTLRKLTGI
jgi:hypothetical protein